MTPSPKHQTRIDNLAAIRAVSSPHGSALCAPNGQLRVDWLELAGPDAPTAKLLIDADALNENAKFIGVDNDPKVITAAKKLYRRNPNVDLRRVEGNFVNGLDTDAYDRVGILIFDSWNGAKGRETDEHLDTLFAFAARQRKRLGGFCLGLNVTLRGVSLGAGVAAYKRKIEMHYGAPIPETAWQTYKSNARSNPMLLTRLFWL